MGGQVVCVPKECVRRYSIQLGELMCVCVYCCLWNLGAVFRGFRRMEGAIFCNMACSFLS